MAKTIKLSEIPEVSRKEMAHQILIARDSVGKAAKASTNAAVSDWKSSAPRRTGRMASALQAPNGTKGQARITIPNGTSWHIINYVNQTPARRGFLDKWKRRNGSAFYRAATSKLK